jgi:hypothetical protein
MEPSQPKTKHKGIIVGLIIFAIAAAFLVPVFAVNLSPSIWYPSNRSPGGLGSFTYEALGYGAVFWGPNHYWLFLGDSTLQITNSSASEVTIKSVDQNGAAIFGYYTVFSDSSGHVLQTGYTTQTFSATAGLKYTIQVEDYKTCRFSHWENGVNSTEIVVLATSGNHDYAAVYDC